MKLKAYSVYPGSDPQELGCCLVFAVSRNQAKMKAYLHIHDLWLYEYIDFVALRVPAWDQYAKPDATEAYIIHQNDELPEGAMRFYEKGVFP